MRHFQVGDARVTRISELNLDGVDAAFLYPGVDPEQVRIGARPLSAGSFDPSTGTLRQSIHTWLVEIGGLTVLIDTATGNDKQRPTMPPLDQLNEPYLERLAQAGVQPDDVDAVLMTHVHADHVGWNTRLQDGAWVPTFPHARYLASGVELDYGAAVDADDEAKANALRQVADLGPMSHLPAAGIYTDSVAPVSSVGLIERVNVGEGEVLPGFSYHSLPGHSIDHAAILLNSNGHHALFWGDVLHHPVQVTATEWNSVFCEFPDAAVTARRKALAWAADTGATVFTTHFAESSAGRVTRDGDAFVWTFVEGTVA